MVPSARRTLTTHAGGGLSEAVVAGGGRGHEVAVDEGGVVEGEVGAVVRDLAEPLAGRHRVGVERLQAGVGRRDPELGAIGHCG